MNGSGEVKPIKGSGNSPWDKDRPVKPIRAPKLIDEIPPSSDETQDGDDHLDKLTEVLRNSSLNVNAVEFVPKCFQMNKGPSPEDIAYLTEAIDVMTHGPGRYEEFLTPISEIAETYLHDLKSLEDIIDMIIERCIVEPNFRYTGARLCSALSSKFCLTFINCLLARCKEKFTSVTSTLRTSSSRTCAFGLLLAELFLQITIGDPPEHIKALAHGLESIVTMLLGAAASDTIKTVCLILKLCGEALEREGVALQPIYDRLKNLFENGLLDDNVRYVVSSVLQQRSNWKSNSSPVEGQGHVPNSTKVPLQNDPVFYGPDGQVLSEEERSFLRENIPPSDDLEDYILDDDEVLNDEEDAAYEEFINGINES